MSKTRMIARLALIAAALSTAGAATVAVTLPAKANSHAVTATANVTTGSSNGQSGDVHPASTPSPNSHADFGQCVAANAKTASDNGGKGWNPTMGCTNANAQSGNDTSANGSASTGLTTAGTHANSHASAGLEKAAAGRANSH